MCAFLELSSYRLPGENGFQIRLEEIAESDLETGS